MSVRELRSPHSRRGMDSPVWQGVQVFTQQEGDGLTRVWERVEVFTQQDGLTRVWQGVEGSTQQEGGGLTSLAES